MGLQEYNRKRHFKETPEPRGEAGRSGGGPLSFVVQLHHARARHYDFRLEVEGVLHSWAVPRGPSFRPGEKRLAVEVEDHPLAYADFEGIIPEGEYGAGHVAIFDHGTWEPDGDPAAAIRRGKLDFSLDGERLKGRWSLVRTGRRGSKPQWLLFKRTDEFAGDLEADDLIGDLPPPPRDAPGASTAEGLEIRAEKGFTVDAADTPEAGKAKKRAGRGGAKSAGSKTAAKRKGTSTRSRKASTARSGSGQAVGRDLKALVQEASELADGARFPMGEFVQPMLTVSADEAPGGDDWVHEWKWDGYRLLGLSGEGAMLWSRNGLSWNERAPDLIAMLEGLGASAVLDGELIAIDSSGYSDFNGLQRALMEKDAKCMRYVVFDLLALEGHDLRDAPLLERKALLERLLDGADPRFFYSTHIVGRGAEIFDAARERGMEGIISKRADSRYVHDRTEDWLKVKVTDTRDFVVVGYTPPKGRRKAIGSLMLARYEDGELVYAGRVGSGMTNDFLVDLLGTLKPLETDDPVVDIPKHVPLPAGRITWLRPELVIEVFFRGWGKEGLVRQASFHRLRPDKPATPEALEQPEPVHVGADEAAPADEPATRKRATSKRSKKARRDLPEQADESDMPRLTSPERVVYPDAGHTKQDVFDYYLKAAPQLLDEIGGRLLSVIRCPEGIDGQRFFQKNAHRGFGDAVKRFELQEADGGKATYFYVDDVPGLMTLVQMNALEFHPWGSTVDHLEQPDRIVFDLDPDPGIEWNDIRAAAKDVRARLREVGLESYPKLSGGKGVHVVVPLAPDADWAQVHAFCEAFADAMAQQAPERYVATASKAKREGRIFIDWLRNSRGATSVAGWSLRARPGAPVAMPLTWASLARVDSPNRYSLVDAAARGMPDEIRDIIRSAGPLRV